MQHSWTEAELAYFAGIIDGEGSFVLHKHRSGYRFACQIQIGNTDVRLMEWIYNRFGGSVNPERRSNLKHKPVYRWVCQADTLDILVGALLPYLVVKREQAEVILAYRRTLPPVIRTRRSTNDVPEHVKAERMRLHSSLAVLNRRGA